MKDPPRQLFNESRAKYANDSFKSSASEMLSIYQPFRELVRKCIGPGILVAHVRSLLALFRVLDGYAVFQLGTPADGFVDAVVTFLQLHHEAYPEHEEQPKYHKALHVAESAARLKRIYTTFPLERKHKVAKVVATRQSNLRSFEAGVCVDLICDGARAMNSNFAVGARLLKPRRDESRLTATLGAQVLHVSRHAYSGRCDVSSGDVCMHNERRVVCLIRLILQMDDDPISALVEVYTPDGQDWVRIVPGLRVVELGHACVHVSHLFIF